ncbi:predicted protein [Brucella abortus NCTC 8038]|nr:predicted protein [Brucella abortus NCTC 8038]
MLIIFDASVSLSLLFREPVIAALTSWVNFFLPFPLVSRLQPGVRIRKFF